MRVSHVADTQILNYFHMHPMVMCIIRTVVRIVGMGRMSHIPFAPFLL